MFNEVFLAKKNDYQTIEDSCQYFFLKNETFLDSLSIVRY